MDGEEPTDRGVADEDAEDDAEARRWFDTLVDDIRDYLTLEPKGPRPPPEG